MSRVKTVFLFDLDGTLLDSVYQHVLAWKEALVQERIDLSVWRIHRKIGMSGGLFTDTLLSETGLEISPQRVERLRQLHARAYTRHRHQVHPLPGGRELLNYLTENEFPGQSRPAVEWRRRGCIWTRLVSILPGPRSDSRSGQACQA